MTDSHSPDLSEDLKQQLQALVPAAFKDGQLDTETLQQLLGIAVVPSDERYGLNWAGKADSYRALQYPTSATLKPRKDQSVNFEHAQHVFIEGENLEVLKTLQRAYFGKVKLIYIDPPYNTGSDSFIYPDRFQESREDYLKRIESLDIDGNITKEGLFRKNSSDNGHYHSNWLSMMLPRLYLARNLLRDDGVIFISIDDNEQSDLKLLCDEIFGADNFEGHIHWRRRHNQPNDKTKMIGLVAEHILSFSKNKEFFKQSGVGKVDLTGVFSNPDKDHRGDWASKPWKVGSDQSGSRYVIKNPTNNKSYDEDWMGEEATYLSLLNDNRIVFSKNGDGLPRKKYFRFEREEEGQCATNWWGHEEFGHNQGANDEMTSLFGIKNIFSNPKPVELVRGFIQLSNAKNNDIILDFFAGSSSTAHAVIEMNIEDGGSRKFICVQMPEPTDETCEAYKTGYKTIADISRERIRRVLERIKKSADLARPVKEHDSNLGFRAFELAPSNFKQWRGDWAETPEELDKQLALMLPTEKRGATSLNMAFELLLKNGRPLASQVELKIVIKTPVHIVWTQDAEAAENTVVLMFVLECMQLEALPAMLALKPKHIVFLDSVFKNNDSVKVNVALQCESAGVKFSSI